MRTVSILATLVLTLPSVAHASRWVALAPSELSGLYIDADALVREGGTVTVWLKTESMAATKRDEAIRIEKWIHDCDNSRAKLVAITKYKANGGVISSAEAPNYDLPWTNIALNSKQHAIHSELCNLSNFQSDSKLTA